MLFIKPDCPVDALTVAVSREIDQVARELNVPYFLVGAMARDIVLTHVYGIDIGRATRDVDFGIAVRNWEQFDVIKDKLVRTGRFSVADRIAQRIYYTPQGISAGYPVDIIPFGGVEAPRLSIAWPPERELVMSVVGYDEALATAILVKVDDALAVPIASLPGLALLKFFAWQDRHAETAKDAIDLVTLFRNYHAAGNQERIYGEELGLFEAVDFDIDLASPRLLGKDVRHIASAATLAQVLALLGDAQKVDRLLTHMSVEFKAEDDSIGAAARLLEQFKTGLAQE
jgi:predicted nucleotidyltransferase